jgi:hypothetical protein
VRALPSAMVLGEDSADVAALEASPSQDSVIMVVLNCLRARAHSLGSNRREARVEVGRGMEIDDCRRSGQ